MCEKKTVYPFDVSPTEDPVAVLPHGIETFVKHSLKLSECRAVGATEHFNVFQWQLEGSRFKTNVSRRIREHKPEVNVYKMSISMQ